MERRGRAWEGVGGTRGRTLSPSVPGTTGTPAAMAASRADVLSANVFRLSTVGPAAWKAGKGQREEAGWMGADGGRLQQVERGHRVAASGPQLCAVDSRAGYSRRHRRPSVARTGRSQLRPPPSALTRAVRPPLPPTPFRQRSDRTPGSGPREALGRARVRRALGVHARSPTKVMPLAASCLANSGDSDRKPAARKGDAGEARQIQRGDSSDGPGVMPRQEASGCALARAALDRHRGRGRQSPASRRHGAPARRCGTRGLLH